MVRQHVCSSHLFFFIFIFILLNLFLILFSCTTHGAPACLLRPPRVSFLIIIHDLSCSYFQYKRRGLQDEMSSRVWG